MLKKTALLILGAAALAPLPHSALIGAGFFCALWAVSAYLSRGRYSETRYFILGLAVLTLPILGEASLPIALFVLAADDGRSEEQTWAAPFLLCILANLIILWGLEFDPIGIRLAFFKDRSIFSGLLSFRRALSLSPPIWLFETQQALKILTLTILAFRLSDSKPKRTALAAGLVGGALFNALVLCFESAGLVSRFSSSSIFHIEGRAAGLFTDPNALGVSALLLASPWACLVQEFKGRRERVYSSAIGALLLLMSFASGSKTLGLGLIAALGAWFLLRFRLKALIAFASLSVISIWLQETSLLKMLLGILPDGPARALAPILSGSPLQVIKIKLQFLAVDWQVFLDNPLSGIGLGGIIRSFPLYARRLGFETGVWSDNPNSFFLGILADFGIVGVLGFLLCFRSLRANPKGRSFDWAILLGFSASLMFGSHFAALEVCVLFAFLLARVVVFSGQARVVRPMILLGAFFLLSLPRGLSSEYGTYPFEGSGGSAYRWIAPRAGIILPCGKDGKAALRISAPPEVLPMSVQIIGRGPSSDQVLRLTELKERRLEFVCASDPEVGEALTSIRLDIRASKAFSPSARRRTDDGRILSLMLASDDALESKPPN